MWGPFAPGAAHPLAPLCTGLRILLARSCAIATSRPNRRDLELQGLRARRARSAGAWDASNDVGLRSAYAATALAARLLMVPTRTRSHYHSVILSRSKRRHRTSHVCESVTKWMNGSAKRQCDRTLGPCRVRARRQCKQRRRPQVCRVRRRPRGLGPPSGTVSGAKAICSTRIHCTVYAIFLAYECKNRGSVLDQGLNTVLEDSEIARAGSSATWRTAWARGPSSRLRPPGLFLGPKKYLLV